MSRRRKKVEENNGGGAPLWMATFSDLMTLLLTFFILLYSISTIDIQKLRNISYSLQAVLLGEGQPTILDGQPITENSPLEKEILENEIINESTTKDSIVIMYTKIKKFVEEEDLEAVVSVTTNKRGVFIDIKEAILFEPGKAEIKKPGIDLLQKFVKLFQQFPNKIVIEGHTDNVPISTSKYPSNWELSTARALSVVRYLSEDNNVIPSRLSATGFGEYQPIAANDSSVNRALNRRVNILIIIDDESSDIIGTETKEKN